MSEDLPLPRIIDSGGGGGGGDIFNGGQVGPVTIGTTNATDMKIISGAEIQIGDSASADEIHLNGSLSFQYEELSAAIVTETLDDSHYFVEVTSATTTTIQLPAATIAAGRQYVIANSRPSGKLTILPAGADVIDGTASQMLPNGRRFTIMSNGMADWYIV